MTKLTLLAAAAAVLLSSPVIAQERAHERRIPHRPDRPVSCYSFCVCTSCDMIRLFSSPLQLFASMSI